MLRAVLLAGLITQGCAAAPVSTGTPTAPTAARRDVTRDAGVVSSDAATSSLRLVILPKGIPEAQQDALRRANPELEIRIGSGQ